MKISEVKFEMKWKWTLKTLQVTFQLGIEFSCTNNFVPSIVMSIALIHLDHFASPFKMQLCVFLIILIRLWSAMVQYSPSSPTLQGGTQQSSKITSQQTTTTWASHHSCNHCTQSIWQTVLTGSIFVRILLH